jgi:GDP-4-dehydro-6-deoxy-D-mannose reductase
MKKVLITGISGFAGSFLAEHLLKSSEVEVSGTYIAPDLTNLNSIQNNVHLYKVDLSVYSEVEKLIHDVMPDTIYHLAALTSPAQSFVDSTKTVLTNIEMEMNILNAVLTLKLAHTRLLLISSSEIYGLIKPSDLPIDEQTALRPASPYAVSKIAQDYLGLQYFLSHKLDCVRLRPFNHTGPRQAPVFVVPTFCKQIAEIEKGKHDAVIQVGNLEAKRDFTDVRDMVAAYALLAHKGQAGEVYNIGSGTSYKIEDILHKLLALSTKEIKIEVDQSRFMPIDIPELVCDRTKIEQATGWKPTITIDQTLKDTLEYWRNAI